MPEQSEDREIALVKEHAETMAKLLEAILLGLTVMKPAIAKALGQYREKYPG